MPDDLLTIGDLARRTRMATSALRYYEELGLLPRPTRVSGQRRYPPSAVELVGVILLLRDVGFALGEMKTLLASRSRSPEAWRALVRRKVADLDDQIAKAGVARIALEHALRCPREDLLECPNFWDVVAARLAGTPLEEVHAPPAAR
ncbi:MAG: MerR family transcriptional regulator [Actinobacteria bacterium]|nr:MAG: MerR family transcriptional regulator [Actinomycetota bacterium]